MPSTGMCDIHLQEHGTTEVLVKYNRSEATLLAGRMMRQGTHRSRVYVIK